MRKKGIYGLIAIASYFIRQFWLPNPFSMMKNGILINYVVGGFLAIAAFILVGKIYRRGELPVIGSILFLFVYTIIHFEVFAAFYFYPNWVLVVTIITVFGIVDYCLVRLIEGHEN